MKTVALSVVDTIVLGMFFLTMFIILIASSQGIEQRLDRIIELLENPPSQTLTGDKEIP